MILRKKTFEKILGKRENAGKQHLLLSSHFVLSHITTVETMERSVTGMNPVAMTIINPRK